MQTRRLFGLPGQPLTGPESRALRTSLNLERRHVVALCNALHLRRDETTAGIVTNWERAKERGYPENLTTALEVLETGVDRLCLAWAAELLPSWWQESPTSVLVGEEGSTKTLRRPLGAKRIVELLRPADLGVVFDEVAMGLLDQSGGDFWLALADAAVARAAILLRNYCCIVRVVLDKEPD